MDLSFCLAMIQKRERRRRPELPMELVMDEILTRLPARSLMKFKCVSKLWSSHIRSRYFSNCFITVSSRPRPRLYMCLTDLKNYRNLILSTAPDTSNPSSFVVDHDVTIPGIGSYIFQDLCGFMCNTVGLKLKIFNPTTRQLVTLPDTFITPQGEEGNRITSYYFGHDPVNDEYKVVCSICVYSKLLQKTRTEHWVFVLKPGGGSWKKVAPTSPGYRHHIPGKGGECIDGVIYYLALTNDNYKQVYNFALVSFHIKSEEFKTIQVPRIVDELPRKKVGLVDYGGKITLVNLTNFRGKGMVDLWVLEDATNMEWSRKSLVVQPSQLHLVGNFIFKAKCTTQKQKLFFIPLDFVSHVLCYDLQINDIRIIEIKGVLEHLDLFSMDKANILFDLIYMDQHESVIHLEI